MEEQWQKLKETITELRENGDAGTQQEVYEFLADLMDMLEEHMENQDEWIPVSKQAIVAMLEKLVIISFKERNQKLIDAAQMIKDFCDNHACGDCPFYCSKYEKFFYNCEFWNNVPWHWDLSEEEDCKGE